MKNSKLAPAPLAAVCAALALSLLPLAAVSAQTGGDIVYACYIPGSGMVYRVDAEGVEGLREECRAKGHIEFSWSSTVPLAGLSCPPGEFVIGVDAVGAPICAAPPPGNDRDVDGDGYVPDVWYGGIFQWGGDCDDTDPNVHPGVGLTRPRGESDVQDGVDSDCDGLVDGTYYLGERFGVELFPEELDCTPGTTEKVLVLFERSLERFEVQLFPYLTTFSCDGCAVEVSGWQYRSGNTAVELNLMFFDFMTYPPGTSLVAQGWIQNGLNSEDWSGVAVCR